MGCAGANITEKVRRDNLSVIICNKFCLRYGNEQANTLNKGNAIVFQRDLTVRLGQEEVKP